jgi:acyl carrier protein
VAERWPVKFDLLIRQHCRFVESGDDFEAQTPMHMLGVDSLEIVELIVDLEEQYNISFPEDFLTPQVFATPMTIWDATSLLSGIQPPAANDHA